MGLQKAVSVVFVVSGLIVLGSTFPCLVGAQILNDPSVTSEDNFGYSVAIDGLFIMVGDRRDDSVEANVGRAHLYGTADGQFVRTFDDPTETNQDNFGSAVGASNEHVIVGALFDTTQGPLVGQAVLFSVDSGVPLHILDDPSVTIADFFGSAVDVDGQFAIVGAPGDDSNGFGIGQVHVFDVTTGQLCHTLTDPTPTGFDSFGSSVAIDGQLVIVGEPGDDTHGFGVGSAHVFNASTGQLVITLNDPTTTVSDEFGTSVALFGNRALVGAPGDDTFGSNSGQAYLFDIDSGELLQTFNDPDPSNEDEFGRSVALSGDFVLIGAPNAINESGASSGQVFLFNVQGSWRETFESQNGQDEDLYGFSVAIFEMTLVIGAPCADFGGSNIGSAQRIVLEPILIGDVNRDGAVDLLDVSPFIEVLTTSEFQPEADINSDGTVDLLDVSPIIDLLIGA